jgi:hypothetical protein
MTPDYGEPWRLFPPKAILTADGRLALAPGPRRARLVACVNALAGVADPAAELARLREERDRLREATDALLEHWEDGGTRIGDFIAALRGPQPEEASNAR